MKTSSPLASECSFCWTLSQWAGEPAFCELRGDLLNWYTETRVSEWFGEDGQFHWLWQDVQRYWRSLRARSCWLHADEPFKAIEVNVKLRSSRLILIVGFLQAIAAAHSQQLAPDIDMLQPATAFYAARTTELSFTDER